MKKEISKELIINTAMKLSQKEGIKKLSLGKIARKLNIKTPSLYNHIDGVDGVKYEIIIRELKRLEAEFYKARINYSKKEAVVKIAEAYMLFSQINNGLYETILALDHNKEVNLQVDRVLEEIRIVFLSFGISNVEYYVTFFRSFLHGYASLLNIGLLKNETDGSFFVSLKVFINILENADCHDVDKYIDEFNLNMID